MSVPSWSTIAELVRAPAAMTVPGDTLAGAAAAGRPASGATPLLAASSVCLYWAGMALNDYADRDLDRVERPERPIPAGRVTPRTAAAIACALTAAGLGLAAACGRRSGSVAVALAATIWAYDLKLKSGPAGPLAMATARSLDVLMGAGVGGLRRATPTAAIIGLHTLAVTTLSRHEVTGTRPWLPRATLATTAVVGASTGFVGRRAGPHHRVVGAVLLSRYARQFGAAQLRAAREPDAATVRQAVGAGILGLIPLQGALLAGSGATATALPLAAAGPLARYLARRVSPT
jgi:4-hydroxybenzoate polyprenyltransferase